MSSRLRAGEEEEDEEEVEEESAAASPPSFSSSSSSSAVPETLTAPHGGAGESSTATAAPSSSAAPSPSSPMSAAAAESAALLASSMLSLLKPSLSSLSDRLVELQEAQQMLVHTIGVQASEMTERANSDLANSRLVLDRLPAYAAKLARVRKAMAATEATVVRTMKGSEALRVKLEAKDRERAARRTADASGYSQVAAR
jgi:hypothetical protein